MEKKKIKNNQKEDAENIKIKVKFFNDIQFSDHTSKEVKEIFEQLKNVENERLIQLKHFQDPGEKPAKNLKKHFRKK